MFFVAFSACVRALALFIQLFLLFRLSSALFSTLSCLIYISFAISWAFYEILTNMLNAFKQINEDASLTCILHTVIFSGEFISHRTHTLAYAKCKRCTEMHSSLIEREDSDCNHYLNHLFCYPLTQPPGPKTIASFSCCGAYLSHVIRFIQHFYRSVIHLI